MVTFLYCRSENTRDASFLKAFMTLGDVLFQDTSQVIVGIETLLSPVLEECILIQQKYIEKNPAFRVQVFLHCRENPLDTDLNNRLINIMTDYNSRLIISHCVFMQLLNPNHFQYRFLGRFCENESSESISLFDCIDADTPENRQIKGETRPVFEDSVYNFYCERIPQSIAGFRNVLKLDPRDKAAMKYIRRGEEKLK